MASNPRRNTKSTVFPASDVPTRRNKGANSPQGFPALAPWSKLSWGLLVPLALASSLSDWGLISMCQQFCCGLSG
jgi:hypothetical protein